MMSISPAQQSPVHFKPIHQNSNDIMDIYLNKHKGEIPSPLKKMLVSGVRISAKEFILEYQRYNMELAVEALDIPVEEYKRLQKLYDTLLLLESALDDTSRSTTNFRKRCEILSEFIPMREYNLRKYLYGSPARFHLFECLYELIFNKVDWKKCTREVLCYLSGYSDRYEVLTKIEMAKRLNVTRSAVYFDCEVMESDLSNLIRKFRALAPYYSYKSEFLTDDDITIINTDVFNCIRKKERVRGMTHRFTAKVLAVIYNYKMIDMCNEGKEEYWLVKKGVLDPYMVAHLVNKIRKDLKGVKPEDYQKVISKIIIIKRKENIGG